MVIYFIIESVFFEVPRAVFNINIGHWANRLKAQGGF